VISGDREALEQLATKLRLPLRHRLRLTFPRAPSDLHTEASNDALLIYAAKPQAFEVGRNVPLERFLYGIAVHVLRDRLRSDQRRCLREREYAELCVQADESLDGRAAPIEAVQDLRRALPLVCNSIELAAMLAWLDQDDTGVVAVCLGLSHLRGTEQRREVKHCLARIVRRLQRHFDKHQRAAGMRRTKENG